MTIRQSPTSATFAAIPNSRGVGLPRPRTDGKMVLWDFFDNSGFFDGEGKVKFYLPDYQDNNIAVIDATGAMEEDLNYYPYGMPWRALIRTPYLFADKEYQSLSGLHEYIHGARRSVPYACAFSTPDPLCEDRRWKSQYLFCSGNPIRYIDPTGNKVEGASNEDAALLVEDLRAMCPGDEFEKFRTLIHQGGKKGNGKSLAPVTSEALTEASAGTDLGEDQLALVDVDAHHIDAIQTENLILRVMGIPFVNTGAGHGKYGAFDEHSKLPSYR